MEIASALPEFLSAKNSKFALSTIQTRMPVILVKTINNLIRYKGKHLKNEVEVDSIKSVIHGISQLRYELMTDKQFGLLAMESSKEEMKLWNTAIEKHREAKLSWFSAPWLFAECYMYRRLIDLMLQYNLPMLDHFMHLKQEGFVSSSTTILLMLTCVNAFEEDFPKNKLKFFLLCSLWSNEFDLSLSAGDIQSDIIGKAKDFRESLLKRTLQDMAVDELEAIIDNMTSRGASSEGKPRVISILMDNTGPEMVSDFCLGDFLLSSNLADRVVFYPKAFPWFVSDVTMADVEWLLSESANDSTVSNACESSLDLLLKHIQRWRTRFDDLSFSLSVNTFWTLPFGYNELKNIAPELYKELMVESSIVIFKGDLHYRKLLEDRIWLADSTENKVAAFERCFHSDRKCGDENVANRSSPLVFSLRVAKSDVAVGLTKERLSDLRLQDPDWWTKGRYGFAQIVYPLNLI